MWQNLKSGMKKFKIFEIMGHACLAITDQKAFKKHNSKITLNPFIKIVTQTLLTNFPTAELR